MLRLYLFHSIAIYALLSGLYGDFDLNQVLAVHSASKQHTSSKAMRLLGLMWMVTACAARWACYGFVQKVLWLVAARVVMGFFAVCGVF